MKRFIFCLILSILITPIFSQGRKEERIYEIKDEIITPSPLFSFPIEDNIDQRVKEKILEIDSSDSSSLLTLRYSSSDQKASIEYGESFLFYAVEIEEDRVEMKVGEEGVRVFLNGEWVGEKTLEKNYPLFQKAFLGISQILSSPDSFIATEKKTYSGDNWESTITWIIEDKYVYVCITYIDEDSSIWRISGHIEKDKIRDTFTPTSAFIEPYFILDSVKRNGEERDKRLW